MNIHTLAQAINQFLETDTFKDYCPNGLQVAGKDTVKKIGLGVSANLTFFKQAKKLHADTLITHHGLLWNKQNETLTGIHGNRVGFLFREQMNLLGYHLPLDAHPLVGNNACIANILKLGNRSSFCSYGGRDIGLLGSLSRPLEMKQIAGILKKQCGQIAYAYPLGKKRIRRIAIITGGAPQQIHEAIINGADLFITGEVSEQTQGICAESHMNFIALGHYVSEQYGVQALGKWITQTLHLPCVFIPVFNPA